MTLFSRSTTSAIALLAVLVTVALALIVASTGQSSSANATGVIAVQGARYEFVPTACTATDTDFVAAGAGAVDGQAFWVSATSRGMTLTVGTESELQRPDDDQLWLTAVGAVNWRVIDGSIEVRANMVDSRTNDSPLRPATLQVRCPDSVED